MQYVSHTTHLPSIQSDLLDHLSVEDGEWWRWTVLCFLACMYLYTQFRWPLFAVRTRVAAKGAKRCFGEGKLDTLLADRSVSRSTHSFENDSIVLKSVRWIQRILITPVLPRFFSLFSIRYIAQRCHPLWTYALILFIHLAHEYSQLIPGKLGGGW